MRGSRPGRSSSAPFASSSASRRRSSRAIRSGDAEPGGTDGPATTEVMDVDALNSGYAAALLEEYLENPEAVPSEWRRLFESDAAEIVATHPGLARLFEAAAEGNGHVQTQAPSPAPAPPRAEPASDELLGGVAAAMALVKAYRMHGHLAAHLDPLGSEPPGDPALEPERLIPKLTPELQARIPASVLRMYVAGETLAEALPRLQETYTGTIAYEIEHISEHEKRVWLRQAIESGKYRRELSGAEREQLLGSLSRVEESEPPRGRRSGRRGARTCGADRPLDALRPPRSERRAADPDPRRCVVPRPG